MRYLLAASFVTVVAAGAIIYAVPSQAGPSFSNSTMTTTPTHEQCPGTFATYGLLIDVLTGSLHTRWRCLAQVRAGRQVRRQLNAVSPARPCRP
jgi:hypothetical protein